MRQLLEQNDLILIEAAVVERLRRDSDITLHPQLVNAPLLYDEKGRQELRAIYQSYIAIARTAGLPLLLCTPTWRANRERVYESDISRRVNQDAVQFMQDLRDAFEGEQSAIKIGGVIGCKGDCYRPEDGLPQEASEEFHSWQIERLAQSGVDYLIAATLPNIQEAIGIARAMASTGSPYIISFVINREGCLLDGSKLWKAIRAIDDDVASRPLGFMVNCAHPSFLCAASQPRELCTRLIGYQANASSLDHADLDGADQHHADDISRWGEEMLQLNRRYGVKILGGCCGTGEDQLEYLAMNRSAL
jgi:S-methylmethionine-dependent homocysteine/selenocysteine methylase